MQKACNFLQMKKRAGGDRVEAMGKDNVFPARKSEEEDHEDNNK